MNDLPPTGIPPGTYRANRWQPQKMVWWYWALMDAMILEPWKTKKEFAKQFNISEVTFNLVTTSDIFQAYIAERRRGNSAHLDEIVRTRTARVADKALETIETVLEKKKDTIPLDQLTKLADTALERLGFGVKNPASNVTVNTTGQTQVVVPVSLEQLQAARKALHAAEMHHVPIAPEIQHDHTSTYIEREQPARLDEPDPGTPSLSDL